MNHPGQTVVALCEAVGMSRQNYYREKRQRQREKIDEGLVVEWVKEQRRWHPRMGTRKLLRKIQPQLQETGIRLGRDRLFEILRREGLLIPKKRRKGPSTNSLHHFHKHPNLLKEADITGVHQAWVSDLTYIRSEEGWLYLSLVTDDFSRQIVGWEASDGLEAEGCLRALEQALGQLPARSRPIHHSDRGIQYCCNAYTKRLKKRKLKISMTEENHCYENAKAERVNGILKQEYGLGVTFRTKAQARQVIKQAIWLYNEARPHVSLDYQIPAEVHRRAA